LTSAAVTGRSFSAAKILRGTVHALDIDPEMVAMTRAKGESLPNLRTYHRDFVAEGSGLPDSSVGYAMLFNILHCEQPLGLLKEAWRVLVPGGTLAGTDQELGVCFEHEAGDI